ncbi:MAG: cation:proton antiporter [Bacilli bacterium]
MNIIIYSLLYISLALAVGLALSKLMKLIHFPNVTGYLLGGILIGPWVLGLINQEGFQTVISNLTWISDIALGFIAFTIGGSFKLSVLKKVGKRATIITIFEALGACIIVICGLLIGYFLGLKDLGLSIPMILTLGSIACATAPAATLLIIQQYKAKGPVTSTLIPVVAFDDSAALIVFALLFAISKILVIGGTFNFIDGLLIPVLEIIISILIGGLIGLIVSFATKWFKSRNNRLIIIIAAIILCVGLSMINTKDIGLPFSFQLSSLLTVMPLGAVYVNLASGIERTDKYLVRFTAPIFMLFFILSGAQLNFGIFFNSKAALVLLIALIYIITRVIGKWSGAAIGANITKCEPTVKKYLGLTLIPQAGVALGLATSAKTFFSSTGNDIGETIYTCIIVSTIVYELVGPLITKWALTKANEITEVV